MKTAEFLFQGRFDTKSAGLYNVNPLTERQLEWADMVLVMEDEHRTEISKRFPEQYLKKKILSLNIPDVYYTDQPELIKILHSKIKELL